MVIREGVWRRQQRADPRHLHVYTGHADRCQQELLRRPEAGQRYDIHCVGCHGGQSLTGDRCKYDSSLRPTCRSHACGRVNEDPELRYVAVLWREFRHLHGFLLVHSRLAKPIKVHDI